MDSKYMKWDATLSNHQGNEIQNQTYHFTLVRMPIIKKRGDNKFGEDVEKRKSQCTIGGNANWCSNYGKQHRDSSKIKIETIILSSNPSSGYPKRMKTGYKSDI